MRLFKKNNQEKIRKFRFSLEVHLIDGQVLSVQHHDQDFVDGMGRIHQPSEEEFRHMAERRGVKIGLNGILFVNTFYPSHRITKVVIGDAVEVSE